MVQPESNVPAEPPRVGAGDAISIVAEDGINHQVAKGPSFPCGHSIYQVADHPRLQSTWPLEPTQLVCACKTHGPESRLGAGRITLR